MPPEDRGPAKWSTNPGQIQASTSEEDGVFELTAPLLDDRVLQGQIRMVINPNRELTFYWEPEPDAAGLNDFRAWMRPGGSA